MYEATIPPTPAKHTPETCPRNIPPPQTSWVGSGHKTQTHIDGYIHAYINACIHACMHTCMHPYRHTMHAILYMNTPRHTDRQAGRQTDRQRQTSLHRYMEMWIHRVIETSIQWNTPSCSSPKLCVPNIERPENGEATKLLRALFLLVSLIRGLEPYPPQKVFPVGWFSRQSKRKPPKPWGGPPNLVSSHPVP